jgi:ribose 5-phosphate isomerase A
MSSDILKRNAGQRAADEVRSGMGVGLGSGSTARYATLSIGERLRAGRLRDILGVPTSRETARLAAEAGIPLAANDDWPAIDLTIDGADEVDPQLNVIKGLGGALLHEKIVAAATRRQIIVVDESKLIAVLGSLRPVPVEVVAFGWPHAAAALERTGATATLRQTPAGRPFVTDEGHYIVDCRYPGIARPSDLATQLSAIPGVVEHGLFLGLVHQVVVAAPGTTRILGSDR